MAVMGAGAGFAKGFAEGMEKNFRAMAAEDADAAKLAASRYEENRKNFFEQEKADQEKIKQAEQLVNQLYPGLDTKNKEARKSDIVQLLRSDGVTFKDAKELMEERIYEEIKEQEKKKEEVVKAEETPVEKSKTGDIVSQTEMLLSEEDADKTGGIVEKDGKELPGGGDGIIDKDADAKGKVDSRDPNFLQQIFTEEGREFAKEKRVDRRLDKLTGVDADIRKKFNDGFIPTDYTEASGTTFTLKQDPDKIPQYQKITSVTKSNVQSYITAAQQAGDEDYVKLYTALADNFAKNKETPDSIEDVANNLADLRVEKQFSKPGEWTPDRQLLLDKAIMTLNILNDVMVQNEQIKDIKPGRIKTFDENNKVTFIDVIPIPGNPSLDQVDRFRPINGDPDIEATDEKYQLVTRDEIEQAEKIRSSNDSEITKYKKDFSANLSGLEQVNQLVGLVQESNGAVLTRSARLAAMAEGAIAEFKVGTEVISNFINKDTGRANEDMFDEGILTQEAFELEMKSAGAMKNDETLDSYVERIAGKENKTLAEQYQLFESKLLLAAFRMGRLEGQQGNAMSNRDFEKLMQIIRPTRSSEEVFYTQIADYFGGRLSILNVQADNFMDSDRVQTFINDFGYSPYINMDNPVQYVEDYLANPNNKGANKDMVGGYNFIMQRKDLGPQIIQGQNKLQEVSTQEQFDALEPGETYIEVYPDGSKVKARK